MEEVPGCLLDMEYDRVLAGRLVTIIAECRTLRGEHFRRAFGREAEHSATCRPAWILQRAAVSYRAILWYDRPCVIRRKPRSRPRHFLHILEEESFHGTTHCVDRRG